MLEIAINGALTQLIGMNDSTQAQPVSRDARQNGTCNGHQTVAALRQPNPQQISPYKGDGGGQAGGRKQRTAGGESAGRFPGR
jgi:hypothetical protein